MAKANKNKNKNVEFIGVAGILSIASFLSVGVPVSPSLVVSVGNLAIDGMQNIVSHAAKSYLSGSLKMVLGTNIQKFIEADKNRIEIVFKEAMLQAFKKTISDYKDLQRQYGNDLNKYHLKAINRVAKELTEGVVWSNSLNEIVIQKEPLDIAEIFEKCRLSIIQGFSGNGKFSSFFTTNYSDFINTFKIKTYQGIIEDPKISPLFFASVFSDFKELTHNAKKTNSEIIEIKEKLDIIIENSNTWGNQNLQSIENSPLFNFLSLESSVLIDEIRDVHVSVDRGISEMQSKLNVILAQVKKNSKILEKDNSFSVDPKSSIAKEQRKILNVFNDTISILKIRFNNIVPEFDENQDVIDVLGEDLISFHDSEMLRLFDLCHEVLEVLNWSKWDEAKTKLLDILNYIEKINREIQKMNNDRQAEIEVLANLSVQCCAAFASLLWYFNPYAAENIFNILDLNFIGHKPTIINALDELAEGNLLVKNGKRLIT